LKLDPTNPLSNEVMINADGDLVLDTDGEYPVIPAAEVAGLRRLLCQPDPRVEACEALLKNLRIDESQVDLSDNGRAVLRAIIEDLSAALAGGKDSK
jgi:hypothetical protein